MTTDPNVRAYALGYEGATYAAERAAATEDAELRDFLRKTGATHFLRQPDGSVLAYDDRNRERVVSPPRPTWQRWHCERGANWRPRRGAMPGEAEQV